MSHLLIINRDNRVPDPADAISVTRAAGNNALDQDRGSGGLVLQQRRHIEFNHTNTQKPALTCLLHEQSDARQPLRRVHHTGTTNMDPN